MDALPQVLASVEARLAVAVDDRESRSIERFLAECARLSRPFDEHADPVHITGSAIVVGERGVVLHFHKRLAMWLQPGGHIDDGEPPWDAALRETIEETGLVAVRFVAPDPSELAHVDVHLGGRGHTHLDLRYLLTAPPDDPAPPEDESQDVRWFAWDDAIEAADPGLAGALRSLRP